MVYQGRKSLPIDTPIGNQGTINDSSLILYYKFD